MTFDAASLAAGIWSMPWASLDFSPGLQPASGFTASQLTPARNPPQPSTQTQDPQHTANPAATSLTESKWFLAPSTWRIDHWPAPAQDSYPIAVMANFNRGLQAWVKRWVMEGHNPFIHRSLYAEGGHFPPCIQDAFTTASAYYHKTTQNEGFIYRVLDERVAALVASQPENAGSSLSAPILETRDHLARVHALYVYTIIRLYDGSISQRAAAEDLFPTLDLWSRQLWESALLDINTLSRSWLPGPSKYCPSNSSLSASREVTCSTAAATETSGAQDTHQNAFERDHLTWTLWVLSESIRRTWIIVSCTIGVYNALKGRWGECAGGAQFTARAGLWDAKSAPRWAAIRREDVARRGGDAGPDGDGEQDFFIPSMHSEGLFRSAAAAEVDEFARHLFTCIWGLDRVEDWALKTSSKGKVDLEY
ncbi:transcription factor gsfR2 [Colletotrichum spaethianum]|uniref:Transcription factor gsfR2 n=1 Tax=Colletotrichum spaethianum TaxID=700344 RepID=A0AA37LF64_9PEZI|nr:transcription factor gsfR2 [Colletotrichum spaethianum]GKT45450.1 transcription factor gsfR2 [Colletotrichum spaethianum]